jgi:hypothetical protein
MKKTFILMMVVGVMSVAANAGVIYQDDFSGSGTADVVGTTPDVTTGGNQWGNSNGTSPNFKDNGMFVHGGTALLAFTPQQGNIYTVSADIYKWGDQFHLFGFFDTNAYAAGGWGNQLGAWRIYNDSASMDRGRTAEAPLGQPAITSVSHNYKIVIDATSVNSVDWTTTFYLDGVKTGGPATAIWTPLGYGDVAYVGFSQWDGVGAEANNFQLTVVPEPATLALLGLGSLLLRRKRK